MAEKFEEKTSGEYDAFGKKGGLWTPKEERGHIRSTEEVEKAKESIPEDKKIEGREEKERKTKEEYDAFHGLGTRGKEKMEAIEKEMAQEKKAVESAEIPKKGMETREILKEVGIQKPAESFKEVQERLAERLDKSRNFEGKKLSEDDRFVETRKFYLEELGYSIKYKGVLLDKAEILDENGKSILNDKGKALEFKSFYFNKTETQINDFLKGKLQEKFDGKSAEKLTEEQNLDKGFEKSIKKIDLDQTIREGKIAFAKAKDFSAEKFNKLKEGVTRLSSGVWGKLGIGYNFGKKLALEGGKDLMAIGLSPAVAIEEAGREIVGSAALREKKFREERIQEFEQKPRFKEYTEFLRKESQQLNEKWTGACELLHKKGKILRFLEFSGGRFGQAMGERLTPHPSKKEKYE
ncbi:MAG: hypothetical protein ABH841_01850 [Candidatus Nealsonbacteria bacterium]